MAPRPNIRVINTTGLPQDTQLLDMTTRIPLQGVEGFELRVTPGEIPKVKVELAGVVISAEAEPVFRMQHPISGEWKEIKRVLFKDDTEWPPRPS